jgi:4-amino-4-deoxy-L-arabinose transferase-like glycosyltransferase
LRNDGEHVRRLGPRPVALAALGVALYAAPLAFSVPLLDPDEGLHAAIAREMAERREFTIPRLLGEPFLDKPILFFAAEALSILALGATEFAVRLPGQLFGLLGALTTGIVAAMLAGRHAGIAAAAVYATLAFPLGLNQAAVHDIALVPWTNLAMCGFLLALGRRHDGAAIGWCAFAGLWLGLATLTKGLTGLALVGLPVAALALLEGRLTVRLVLGGLLSILLALLVALPWYLAVERAEPGYLRYFFVERHLLGFATTTQQHGHRAWWYYLPVVLAGSLPWVVTAVGAIGRPAADPPLARIRRVSYVWLVAGLAFLSLAGSKLATYALPVFPAVALLVTLAWLETPVRHQGAPAVRFAWLVTAQAVVGAAVLPLALTWAHVVMGLAAGPWDLAGAAAVTAGWLALARNAGQWPLRVSFTGALAGMAATLVMAYATVFPKVAAQQTARDLAAYFNAQGMVPAHVRIVDERVGSVLFYLQPQLRRPLRPGRIEGVPLGRALVELSALPGAVVALPEDAVDRLSARLVLDDLPFHEAGRYRVYETVVLRGARPRPEQSLRR